MKPFMSFHIRDAGLMLLSVGSGSSDALPFVVFGSVFSSAMTGNTALIGIASGRIGARSLDHRAPSDSGVDRVCCRSDAGSCDWSPRRNKPRVHAASHPNIVAH